VKALKESQKNERKNERNQAKKIIKTNTPIYSVDKLAKESERIFFLKIRFFDKIVLT
jgi:hypothetical protein